MNLQPTFNGVVVTTQDALILFQAVLSGILPQVTRRPHDRERGELIRSGSVFIFNEQQSGIKRWTDGIAWSPSRIYENFLLYRQLEKPFSPGEKKRTAKRGRKKYSYVGDQSPYARDGKEGMIEPGEPIPQYNELPMGYPHSQAGMIASQPMDSSSENTGGNDREGDRQHEISSNFNYKREGQEDKTKEGEEEDEYSERALVGSLIDSYAFKSDGLIKRTMSIVVNGQAHHLVSYYNLEEARNKRFPRPSKTPGLKDIEISEELTSRQNFRVPLDANGHAAVGYGEPRSGDRPTANQSTIPAPHYYGAAGQQPPPPPMDLGYEIDIPLENNYYRNGGLVGVKNEYYNLQQRPTGVLGQRQVNPSNSYVSGYRPFGSSGLPLPQNQNMPFHAPPQYQQPPPQGEYYYGRQPPPLPPNQQQHHQNDKPATSTPAAGIATSPVASANGNIRTSPSLPPLSQPQGYSYQSYVHDYHAPVNPNVSTTSDPRKLPDTVRGTQQDGGPISHVQDSQPMQSVAGIPGQMQSKLPPTAPNPQHHAMQSVGSHASATGQAAPSFGGYGYGYAPMGQGW